MGWVSVGRVHCERVVRTGVTLQQTAVAAVGLQRLLAALVTGVRQQPRVGRRVRHLAAVAAVAARHLVPTVRAPTIRAAGEREGTG